MVRHGPSEDTLEEKDKRERKEVSPPTLITPQPQRERESQELM